MQVSGWIYPLLYPLFSRLSAERCGQVRREDPRNTGPIERNTEKPGLLRMRIEVINHQQHFIYNPLNLLHLFLMP